MTQKSPYPQYAKTIPELFYGMAAQWPEETVFRRKIDGAWQDIPWKDVEDQVLCIASWLLAQGLEPESAVAIVSHNRVEWVYADYAILSIGVRSCPIYPTNTAEQVAYILEDSGRSLCS